MDNDMKAASLLGENWASGIDEERTTLMSSASILQALCKLSRRVSPFSFASFDRSHVAESENSKNGLNFKPIRLEAVRGCFREPHSPPL